MIHHYLCNYKNLYLKSKCKNVIYKDNKCFMHMYWKPECHREYDMGVQKYIWNSLLIFKRYEKEYNIKIPKFVKYEIF